MKRYFNERSRIEALRYEAMEYLTRRWWFRKRRYTKKFLLTALGVLNFLLHRCKGNSERTLKEVRVTGLMTYLDNHWPMAARSRTTVYDVLRWLHFGEVITRENRGGDPDIRISDHTSAKIDVNVCGSLFLAEAIEKLLYERGHDIDRKVSPPPGPTFVAGRGTANPVTFAFRPARRKYGYPEHMNLWTINYFNAYFLGVATWWRMPPGCESCERRDRFAEDFFRKNIYPLRVSGQIPPPSRSLDGVFLWKWPRRVLWDV